MFRTSAGPFVLGGVQTNAADGVVQQPDRQESWENGSRGPKVRTGDFSNENPVAKGTYHTSHIQRTASGIQAYRPGCAGNQSVEVTTALKIPIHFAKQAAGIGGGKHGALNG